MTSRLSNRSCPMTLSSDRIAAVSIRRDSVPVRLITISTPTEKITNAPITSISVKPPEETRSRLRRRLLNVSRPLKPPCR